jgi:hypothetical protein
MAQISGRYALDTLLGQTFIGSTAAAGVIPTIYSSTSPTFGLWNPVGSGKNIYLQYLTIGYVSTTAAASNFVLGYQTGAGSQAATGSPVTAITAVAPVNGILGLGNSSVMKFFPATATLTTGCSFLMTLGTSQLVTTATTTTGAYFNSYTDFQGTIIVPPGVLIVVGGNIAPLQTVDISLVWEEV